MANEEKHEKLIKMLLCICLGFWGLHQFYLGNNSKGYRFLVLTVCGLGTAVFAALSSSVSMMQFSFGVMLLVSILILIDFEKIIADKL